jgi:glyoxylase-like metal-dependent hydrolase (beta-lactamase superfamily II)
MKVTDGIYSYVWRGTFENNCNSFYFGEPLYILFDPGLKNYVDLLLKNLKDDGIDESEIKYLVNTHCHPDHFEGTLNFIDKDVKLCMNSEEIKFFNQEGPRFFEMFNMPFPQVDFDITLDEGPWMVGDTELQIYHTPGHSPGSVSIYWPEKKTLVCGDLVFENSFGRVDFPGGNGELLKKSIEKISQLDIEILLPGHMEIITGKENVQKNFQLIKQYFSMI